MTAPRVSWRRLRALIVKESRQILRDPSSILLAVVLPLMMIFLYGYGLNLDTTVTRIGVLVEDNGADGYRLYERFTGSPSFKPTLLKDRDTMMNRLETGDLQAGIVIPNDYSARLRSGRPPQVQLLADGAEPNSATFVAAYVQGAYALEYQSMLDEAGTKPPPMIEAVPSYWYNPECISRYNLIPGSISVIMSMVGAILTSLIVAREWERGTMEALLASSVTRTEFLLSKTIPYFGLGLISMTVCTLVATTIMGVPMRGSWWLLYLLTALFLGSALGMGLFLSTTLRNQFNAAQAALLTALLPNMLLSGFIFEITSMPWAIRTATYLLPARYFVNALQTHFQAGNIAYILCINIIFLLLATVFWIGLTARYTKKRLDD